MAEPTPSEVDIDALGPELGIPDLCLVVLVGASGSGKSTFAARNFLPTEVISSDQARAMVSDNENDQSVTAEAFDLVHHWAAKRLQLGRLTVIDATNVQRSSREPLVKLARDHDVLPVAIVLDVPTDVCHERNEQRPDRTFGSHVTARHNNALRRSVRHLRKEGFRHVHHLKGVEQVEGATIRRDRRWTDRRDLHGPFDLIGDIHGCHRELVTLLGRLGYRVDEAGIRATHPDGRTAVFVGDLVDRGPGVVETLELVMNMVEDGSAICVAGNHEAKLQRALAGRNVKRTHGLAESLEQLEDRDRIDTEQGDAGAFRDRVTRFLDSLISHYLLDDGRLVVCHAGLPERFHNRSSGRVRSFSLYGETTGETDEFGLPVRYEWARDYRGDAAVVYGHTPIPEATWINNTICLDTGCVFGGSMTALRWPERELVEVPAEAEHYEPTRPLALESGPGAGGGERDPMLLDLADVTGRRHVETSLMGRLTIRADQSATALEVMSRFSVDPRWLAFLPPTMAPAATAPDGDLLERPAEAFTYYRGEGVSEVVCQEKHMGSRAVVIVGRNAEALLRRFGLADHEGALGLVTTRTGRRFFDDSELNRAAVDRIRSALDRADTWDRLGTDWLIIDGELLPWSIKAGELIRRQYAAVGAAGTLWGPEAADVVARARRRGVEGLDELAARVEARAEAVERFRDAYRHYVSPTDGIDVVRFAPFTILAAEGEVTARRDNRWHLTECDRLVDADPDFMVRTERRLLDPGDADAVAEATAWWSTLTEGGGEGMVVKPLDPVGATPDGKRDRVVQPGVKCRGPEYLRIVYGPDYRLNLERLRSRALGRKRSLALREHALGIEALDRFVSGRPLWSVHECVFAILALESEPVDPRL